MAMRSRAQQQLLVRILTGISCILFVALVTIYFLHYHMKTHTDETRGFVIKYPKTWTLKETPTVTIFRSPAENKLDLFFENVNVVVQDLGAKPMNLSEYSERAIEQMKVVFGPNFVVVESKPERLADRRGYKIIYVGKAPEQDLKFMSAWTIKNNKGYQVTYTATQDTYDDYFKTVEGMVKSFKVK